MRELVFSRFFFFETQDSGTTDFLQYTLESVNQICFEEVKRYEVFNIKRDSEDLTVVEKIGKVVCLNNCSSNGECNGGIYLVNYYIVI